MPSQEELLDLAAHYERRLYEILYHERDEDEDEDEDKNKTLEDFIVEDVLDISVTCDLSDRSYRSCVLTLGLGGPNVYIDTADRTISVCWGECVRYGISGELTNVIDSIVSDLWAVACPPLD